MRSTVLPREKGILFVGFGARSTVAALRSMSESSGRGGGFLAGVSTRGAMKTNRALSR
jgi:hypothetical protein